MRDWYAIVMDLIKETKRVDEQMRKPNKTIEDYSFLIGYKTQCLREALKLIEEERKIVVVKNKRLEEAQTPTAEKQRLVKEIEREIGRLEEAEIVVEKLQGEIEALEQAKRGLPTQLPRKQKLPVKLAFAGIIVVTGFLIALGIGYFLRSPLITSSVEGIFSWAEEQGISMYVLTPFVALGAFILLMPLIMVILLEKIQRR